MPLVRAEKSWSGAVQPQRDELLRAHSQEFGSLRPLLPFSRAWEFPVSPGRAEGGGSRSSCPAGAVGREQKHLPILELFPSDPLPGQARPGPEQGSPLTLSPFSFGFRPKAGEHSQPEAGQRFPSAQPQTGR